MPSLVSEEVRKQRLRDAGARWRANNREYNREKAKMYYQTRDKTVKNERAKLAYARKKAALAAEVSDRHETEVLNFRSDLSEVIRESGTTV